MSARVKWLVLGALALVIGIAGGVAVSAATSNAATSTATTTAASQPAAAPSARPTMPAHGTAAHENAEKAVTGAAAIKAKAAAVKAVGGGTAGAVTTDCTGKGYEVTVTKSDGSKVEIHLDSSFNVMQHPGGVGN